MSRGWGNGLSLNISESSNACSIELAKSVAGHFRLSASKRKAILGQIDSAVDNWEKLAAQQGQHRSEIERMKPAFELR